MLRIWLMAMLAAAVLVVARDHDVLHRTGLVGYCTASARPAGTSGSWRACQKGVIDGSPDLSRNSCKPRGQEGEVQFWRCPTKVESGRPVG
jgi:hypothetical protein